MSELTQCNYCGLRGIKRRAKAKGWKVTILAGNFVEMGGRKDIYCHPPDVDIKALDKDTREKYHRSWMMAITDHCVC